MRTPEPAMTHIPPRVRDRTRDFDRITLNGPARGQSGLSGVWNADLLRELERRRGRLQVDLRDISDPVLRAEMSRRRTAGTQEQRHVGP
jgi:hypothetical protein